MRAIVVGALLLVPLVAFPPASALGCIHQLTPVSPESVKRCFPFDVYPPPPPPVGSPPEAYVAWAKLLLLWAVCASAEPPQVEVNDKCGPRDDGEPYLVTLEVPIS